MKKKYCKRCNEDINKSQLSCYCDNCRMIVAKCRGNRSYIKNLEAKKKNEKEKQKFIGRIRASY